MKIGIVGSFATALPLGEGEIHAPLALTASLARNLAEFGHDITYFGLCSENYFGGCNISIEVFGSKGIPLEIRENSGDIFRSKLKTEFEQGYFSKAIDASSSMDLMYFWNGAVVAPLVRQSSIPIVATHHDSTNVPGYNLLYEICENKNFYMIPISKYLSKIIKFNNYLDVVHNG